jgi:AraC family cel operon transcriptional repressor
MYTEQHMRPPVVRLRWRDERPDLPWLRAFRDEQPVLGWGNRHDHDFAEVFWVDRGEIRHQVGGEWQPVRPGRLVFIRPGDIHDAAVVGDTVATNCALPWAECERLRLAYGDGLPAWPWARGGPPRVVVVPGPDPVAVTDRLSTLALDLCRPGQRRLDLDAFVLQLLRAIHPLTRSGEAHLPGWLAEAIAAMRLGPLVSGGVPTLVHLAGRSPEHVRRTVHRHLGMTPTALVNRLRAERAARLLRYRPAQGLGEIAAEVGLGNRAHFHRVFRTAFGCTPAAFRRDGRIDHVLPAPAFPEPAPAPRG